MFYSRLWRLLSDIVMSWLEKREIVDLCFFVLLRKCYPSQIIYTSFLVRSPSSQKLEGHIAKGSFVRSSVFHA